MSDEYTPATADVLLAYLSSGGTQAEFWRWLQQTTEAAMQRFWGAFQDESVAGQ